MQQIAVRMPIGGAPAPPVAGRSLWLDSRVPPRSVKLDAVEAHADRRVLKRYRALDALVFSPRAETS